MKRHIVTVESYSLESGNVGGDVRPVYTSRHRSAKAAARRLAELINGRTARARATHAGIGTGRGGRYTADGLALLPFRAKHGAST